ncbi:sensor histidine kinase [Streptomyces griseofuscus]|uniref:sensor histidine kinase n=1 Tax=Streptomyces griseofuscus TaxID=146922 RepID=UPI003823C65E
MVVQAAAADDVFESNPLQARAALRRTEEAGRQALAELRGFLRTVRADGGADEAALQPTLADVPRLTETMNQAGPAVTLLREGDGQVPPGVQVGVYRIVQEALTNTLRHARASSAQVLLDIDETQVRVRITDGGRGGAGPGRWSWTGGHARAGHAARRHAVFRTPGTPPASRWTPGFRSGRDHDRQGADRRRPGAGALRLPDNPRGPRRPRGGGRGG